ncbi:MAG: SGNH/GDSL hydrolase family protein [Vicinamibacterales bacterium]
MTAYLRRMACHVVAVACAMHWLQGAPAAQADRWAKEMAAFEQQDKQTLPAPGGIVFVGSSSIRLWDLSRSFPGLPVLNRGFGGSQISDSVAHVDLLVIRHKPRTVVFYAGDNDISAGKGPQVVADDFKTFVGKVHAALPQTRVAFIAIKPSIQRWALIAKVREANALIRAFSETDDRVGFIDIDGAMLGWDEKPRKDLLVADGLHLSAKGYELWNTLVRPFIQ